MLSSITTDNCLAILGIYDESKDTVDTPAFEGRIGCLGHQISLISNSVIAEFSKSSTKVPGSELEKMLSHQKKDYEISLDEYEDLGTDDEGNSFSKDSPADQESDLPCNVDEIGGDTLVESDNIEIEKPHSLQEFRIKKDLLDKNRNSLVTEY